jgi:hypothetical protein
MAAQDIIGAMTGELVQSDRLLKLDSPLGNNVLLPQRVVGYSRLAAITNLRPILFPLRMRSSSKP